MSTDPDLQAMRVRCEILNLDCRHAESLSESESESESESLSLKDCYKLALGLGPSLVLTSANLCSSHSAPGSLNCVAFCSQVPGVHGYTVHSRSAPAPLVLGP